MPDNRVDLFSRQFLSCSRVDLPDFYPQQILSTLDSFLPLAGKLPYAHVQRVCKKLLTHSSSQSDEVSERIYELMAQSQPQTPNSHSFSFHLISSSLPKPIAIRTDDKDLDVLVKDGSTGFRIWEAAKFLLSFLLLKRPEIVKDKRILELGAGTGFVGIGLALSGLPLEVVCSDVHDKVLLNIQQFIVESGCSQTAQSRHLDWNNFQTSDFSLCDLIIAADVVYDPSLIEPLVGALKKLIVAMKGGSYALICNAIRTEQTNDAFRTSMEKHGLVWEELVRTSILDKEYVCEELIYGNEIASNVAIFKVFLE